MEFHDQNTRKVFVRGFNHLYCFSWYKDDRKLPKSHRENPSLYTNTTFRLENDPLHDNAITVVFTQGLSLSLA